MILHLLLLIGLSISEVSRIPSSHAKSSVSCNLQLEGSVREVYPQYNIVTGERFIAQIDPVSCSILSTQTHDTSLCLDGTCSDQATSVVKVDDTTLCYCYTDNKSPKPMTATLQADGTYSYSSGSLSDICLNDVTKSSYIELNSADQLLYIATDVQDSVQLGFKYYNILTSTSRTSPSLTHKVTDIVGMFTRGDFLYTIYMDPASKITRSCQKDPATGSELFTFTVASLRCVNTIDGVQVILDRVIDVMYISELDKLFILATRAPISSATVTLCVIDLAQDVDNVFDNSKYITFDGNGDKVQQKQDIEIDCSASMTYPVLTECVDPVKTTTIAMTTKTSDVFSFAYYETNGHHLLYLLGEDRVNVYEYKSDTGETRSITEVGLWTKPSSISVFQDMLYLTSLEGVLISDPYWCSYYLKDPVTCLASMHPSCSYSKTQSRCLPTSQCTDSDECVQSLEDGSFSTVFPDGYSYTVLGTECLNKMFYTDLTVIYHPNTTRTTSKSYRDCSVKPVTKSPEKLVTSPLLSGRELGLLIVAVVCGVAFLLIVTILVFRGKSRVGICNGLAPYKASVRYSSDTPEDKRAIVVSTPTTPSPVSPLPPSGYGQNNNSESGHADVIRNMSSGADPL